MASKKRKLRANFRKNHQSRVRRNDLTATHDETGDSHLAGERVSGKGGLTRKKTIAGGEVVEDASGSVVLPDIDRTVCAQGTVLKVQGLVSSVALDAGGVRRCATRQLLKQLSTDLRHVVAAGDRVWIRPEGADEGIIERVEPRHGVLSRTSRGRRHLIVANVDQVIIVVSVAEPRLKPNLIDRYLVTCEQAGLPAVVCLTKTDLVDRADLMPITGVYAQLGYDVRLLSVVDGSGIEQLRRTLAGSSSVLTGQSGVGKTSLLNALNPDLALRVQTVSEESQKGRHTTTTAELYPVDADDPASGYVIDTPGIRQFQLWDVIPEEVAGLFRDIRPFVSHCKFADCTHTHEDFCAVKDAVADGWIDARRYESYVQIQAGDEV